MKPPKLALDWWIALMVCIHLSLGLAMAWIVMAWPGFDWPLWMEASFLALGCSEVLLLGMWLGFSRAKWWLKLAGFVIGTVWLVFLIVSPDLPRQWRFSSVDDLAVPPIALILIVAGFSLGCRYLVARVVHRDVWPLRPLTEELQFSLRSIIALTVVVALLLALRNLFHWITGGRYSDEATLGVIALMLVLAWTMLLWACLGQGRVAARLPAMLIGMVALGLIFPYYTRGAPWQFAAWSLLMGAIALYSAASLLVIRHCGYRLVSVWRADSTQPSHSERSA
jgi:hypothetical protein